jgi:lipopolysaccharide export system permease protein
MNKLILKKILLDYLVFFSITIIAASIIIWVFQSVNFLDIMIEDGRGYFTYLTYSILNLPKIISRLMPFILFFSFFFILNQYENKNELLIFWNFGVNKIQLVYFFFYCSLILMIIQIFLTSIIVPNTLQYSRSLLKDSNINLFEGFIKPKKFNDTIKDLTIHTEDKKLNGDLINIFLKKDSGSNYQITYAKTGRLKTGTNNLLELYDGQTINNIDGNISKFRFQKSDFSLNNLETDLIEVNKIQETTTIQLFSCLNILFNKEIIFLNNIDLTNSSHNCKKESLDTLYMELYKRFIVPLYIPTLFLITLILIFKSKEESNYKIIKFSIFLTNFFVIIISESSLKFIDQSFSKNNLLIFMPIIIMAILLLNFYYQFNLKHKNK